MPEPEGSILFRLITIFLWASVPLLGLILPEIWKDFFDWFRSSRYWPLAQVFASHGLPLFLQHNSRGSQLPPRVHDSHWR